MKKRKAQRALKPREDAFLPPIGFVRLPAILAVFPVSESSWWAGVKIGRYPKPVKLSPHVSAWRVDDIRKLIEETGR